MTTDSIFAGRPPWRSKPTGLFVTPGGPARVDGAEIHQQQPAYRGGRKRGPREGELAHEARRGQEAKFSHPVGSTLSPNPVHKDSARDVDH